MPTSLLLEGPDITTVLTQVRDTHGPGARIVSAEKVRRGGVAGFFARERFEVAIELPDAVGYVVPDDVVASGPVSLLELTEEVSAQERAVAIGASLSTSRPAFAEVLASIGAAQDPAPRPGPIQPGPEQPMPMPVLAGRRIIPAALVASVFPAPSAPAALTPSPTVLPMSSAPAALPSSPVSVLVPSATPEQPANLLAALAVAARAQHTEPSAADDLDAPSVQERIPTPTSVPQPRREPTVEWSVQAELRALGLPEVLIPSELISAELRGSQVDVYPALVRSLRAGLPRAVVAGAESGDVLAVIGDGTAALEVAIAQAKALGLEERSVLVITARAGLVPAARMLRTADEVSRKAERLAALRRPSVVVVDTAFTHAGADRSRALLAALGASTTWALVEATRKNSDAASWLGRLGRVDALVLENTASTDDPAGVLALYRPVALLERRRATPAAWAGLLCARLAGEEEQ